MTKKACLKPAQHGLIPLPLLKVPFTAFVVSVRMCVFVCVYILPSLCLYLGHCGCCPGGQRCVPDAVWSDALAAPGNQPPHCQWAVLRAGHTESSHPHLRQELLLPFIRQKATQLLLHVPVLP